MLKIDQLSLSYGDHTVLNQLSLTVESGTIHGILGINGAGKTSLFGCLYGILKPEAGSMKFDNKVLHFRHIAFLETGNFFYSYITGKEYLQLCTASSEVFNIDDWNKIFQLPLHQMVDTYSTGMKKQLAFMGVLAQNRPMLILDEPFNGLDLESNEKLHYILQRLRKLNKTILLSSHIMETLSRNCDRISHLSGGKILRTYEHSEFDSMAAIFRAQFRERIGEDLDKVM
jgi:ABC-2 type transport system ATP-binding protein